jgi:acetoacetyl-CoA synthetase
MSKHSLQELWQPSLQRIANANLTRFRASAEERWGLALPDFRALYEWSIAQPQQFWPAVWSFCGVIASRDPGRGGLRAPG